MKKRFFLFFVVICFAMLLAACNNSTTSSTTAVPTTQAPTTQSPTTGAPTTQPPTTQPPTTQPPTTQPPTTQPPTTQPPTTSTISTELTFTVSFETFFDIDLDPISVVAGSTITLPTISKEHLTFIGWYLDDNFEFEFDPDSIITGDITLYALWLINKYEISFDTNGGTPLSTLSIFYTWVIEPFEETTKEGHTFNGWYLDSDLSMPFNLINMPPYDFTLYAKWDVNYYIVSAYQLVYSQTGQAYIPLFEFEELIDVKLGEFHTLALTSFGRVFSWGSNNNGILGNGTYEGFDYPIDISGMFILEDFEYITKIEAGPSHNLALTSNGRVFAWGLNSVGQLGNNSQLSSNIPIDITSYFDLVANEEVEEIYVGLTHSAALTTDNRIFFWGSNNQGEIGNDSYESQLYPLDITDNLNLAQDDYIVSLTLGNYSSYALSSEGEVFSWGYNSYGQLGNSTTDSSTTPISISSYFSLNTEEKVVNLATFGYHVVALTSQNRLFLWGYNSSGQLGNDSFDNQLSPTNMSNFELLENEEITSITVGELHTAFLTSNGRVFIWGENYHGQIGDNSTIIRLSPVDISSYFDLESNEFVSYLELGRTHSMAITNYGRIFSWGNNQYGQLGLGNLESVHIPSSINVGVIELIDFDYLLYDTNLELLDLEQIGYSFYGWYLDTNFNLPFYYEVMPAENFIVIGVLLINEYTITFDSKGGTYVPEVTQDYGTQINQPEDPTKTGHNFIGWFSDEDLTIPYSFISMPAEDITLYAGWEERTIEITYFTVYIIEEGLQPIILYPGEKIISIEGGLSHSGCITNFGRIFMWGLNGSGQLGFDGVSQNNYPIEITSFFDLKNDEIITDIALGFYHSMALTSHGRIFSWGYNNNGQLGNGDFADSYIPMDITPLFDLDNEETIISLEAGSFHSGALTSNGRLFMWGAQDSGALGNGESVYGLSYPTDITPNLDLNQNEHVVLLSLGSYSSVAVTSSNRIFSWGLNNDGQLADGSNTSKFIPQDVTANFGLLLDESIVLVKMGPYHGLLTTSNSRVFTWGRNNSGQLGDNSSENSLLPVDISSNIYLLPGDSFVDAGLGMSHTLLLSQQGRVFAFGSGNSGQLGASYIVETHLPLDITGAFYMYEDEHVIMISAGSFHSLALSSYGNPFAWGYNYNGELGDDTNDNQTIPTILPVILSVFEQISYGLYDEDLVNPEMIQEGFTFVGWFIDNGLLISFDLTKYPENNVNVFGLFIANTYTINFTVDGGPEVESITQPFSSVVEEPSPGDVTGYTFSGWFLDSEFLYPYEFTTMPAEDLLLYGKWTIDQYTISFETFGLFDIDDLTQDYNTTVARPVDPFIEGYTFIDWFSDDSFINPYEFTTMPAENITIYALFVVNTYTITYQVAVYDYPVMIPLFDGEEIVKVVAGGSHTAVLTSLGRVFTWGENTVGALGDGTTIDKNIPVDITDMFGLAEGEFITNISLGYSHSAALSSQGRLFTWGNNLDGQLGDGTNIDRLLPTDITNNFNLEFGENFIWIALGGFHSFALTSDYRIFTWGANESGQLGDNTTISKNLPVEITDNFELDLSEHVLYASLGFRHSAILTSDDRLIVWGDNTYGQLGDSTYENSLLPIDITDNFSLNPLEYIIRFSLGYNHSAVITSEGRLFIWGSNEGGQLGDGTFVDKNTPILASSFFTLETEEIITNFSLGRYHTIVYTSHERVFSFGDNTFGQLADGGIVTISNTPIEITDHFVLALGETIYDISSFNSHVFIITSEGKLISWGYNLYGTLGDGTNSDRYYPEETPITYIVLDSIVGYDYMTPLPNYYLEDENYVFDGWYLDTNFSIVFDLETMPAYDLVLYAKLKYVL